MPAPAISILVPAYGEAGTIEQVLRRAADARPRLRDHRRRRRLAGRRPRRSCSASRDELPQRAPDPPRAQPRQGRRGPHRRSPPRAATSSSSRTPTSSTTRATSRALIEPLLVRRRRRRLRHAPARRRAAARPPLLALRGQPLPLAADERALQHDDQRHGGRLQGVPRRPRALAPPRQRRLPLRARGHGEGPAHRRTSACTRCRSPTTAARSPRARRSPGATASWRWAPWCASVSAPDEHDPVAVARRGRIVAGDRRVEQVHAGRAPRRVGSTCRAGAPSQRTTTGVRVRAQVARHLALHRRRGDDARLDHVVAATGSGGPAARSAADRRRGRGRSAAARRAPARRAASAPARAGSARAAPPPARASSHAVADAAGHRRRGGGDAAAPSLALPAVHGDQRRASRAARPRSHADRRGVALGARRRAPPRRPAPTDSGTRWNSSVRESR